MQQDFWLEKWQNNQTGFHKEFTHPLLKKFITKLNIAKGDSIFVPLCGKTLDMIWLHEQGYKVLAVELSQLAVEQFFAENNLPYTLQKTKHFNVYCYENISIYQGDFFLLPQDVVKNCHAIYDRAALIALPDDMVVDYADKLHELFPSNCQSLLITLEFKKKTGPLGPPFSTSNAKVNRLFAKNTQCSQLYEEDIIAREARFAEQGCQYLIERVYLLSF